MLTIRLTRKGKKNQPFFKVVVADKRRSAKGGRAVEVLGYVDPLTKRRSFKKDRVLHWIKMGAKPSDTIHNLLVSEKIIDAKKIAKHKTKPRTEAAASAAGELKNQKTEEPKNQEASGSPTPAETPAVVSEVKPETEKLPEAVKEEKPVEPEKTV